MRWRSSFTSPATGMGEAQLGEGFAYGAYLPLTSVGEDEVGETFASRFFAQAAVAARDDFAHGGVVVGPFDRTDVELPVSPSSTGAHA